MEVTRDVFHKHLPVKLHIQSSENLSRTILRGFVPFCLVWSHLGAIFRQRKILVL